MHKHPLFPQRMLVFFHEQSPDTAYQGFADIGLLIKNRYDPLLLRILFF